MSIYFGADNTVIHSASGLGAGISQVVSTTKTDNFTVTNQSSFTDITGLSLSITPSSSSNKILILVNLQGGDQGNGYTGFRLLRGSTNIGQSTALDSENANNTRDSAFFIGSESSQGTYKLYNSSHSYLDSPNTTSAITYKVQLITWSSTTFRLNRPNSIGNASYTMAGASTITALEVAV